MPTDHFRYDLLAQDALRGLVRRVLTEAAKKGLPGDHHFFITFNTQAEGVRLSAQLREQYPQEISIVLQHQFWDLKVRDDAFEVGLSFGGVAERLTVPFDAILRFADPSVQFELRFQSEEAEDDAAAAAPAKPKPDQPADESKPKGKARPPAQAAPRAPAASAPTLVRPVPDTPTEPPPDKPGGEVVRLDRFRKK